MSDTRNDHFRIGRDHPALPGHFPGNPLVPGVVLLDRVAASLETRGATLAGFAQVKFVATLRPDDDARIELAANGERWRFRVLRGDDVVASGEALTR